LDGEIAMSESTDCRYEYDVADHATSTAGRLLSFVRERSRVLELGTAAGSMSRHLSRTLGCEVTGVERDPAWAEKARPHCRKFHIFDLDNEWPADLRAERFDFVLAADVLEHLKDPARALARIRECLQPGRGRLLISIPNAAYSGLLAALYCQQFPYAKTGLLDETHLRFFTRDTISTMLAAQGFSVETCAPIELPVEFSEFAPYAPHVPPAVMQAFNTRPEGLAYQYVIQAAVLR
jgi:2-polyprenyl-3-methyl-5-hydroxy-6-metoxy-1,4-benzoquinol methylase